jgi:hypothetical protein
LGGKLMIQFVISGPVRVYECKERRGRDCPGRCTEDEVIQCAI